MATVRDLGAAVRARRHDLGLSQDELSRSAGVSRPWLSRVESGNHPGAELQKVLDLLDVLGLSIQLESAPVEAPADTPDDDPFDQFFAGPT